METQKELIESERFDLWMDLGNWGIGFQNTYGSFSIQILCFEFIFWKH
jgi:hypothetical protein